MKPFVEVTTGPGHVAHSEYSYELAPGAEFAFHPWLASKIREKIGREDLWLKVREISCDEVSCPVTETQIDVIDQSANSVLLLRFGRKKEQINKLDLQLAFDRKKNL
ncbi:hypothetical protein EHQ53_14365 [Leptospira langatensis]|uniref:Uncharacterized protein n=1 Tax=Leptospira langatensis TaxID=2484983 RepID=A0A5F1ZRZ2_9LEPT|nr:hypothetical protein [Leptospira langatensis]TGK01922.1 hypothetical protein EHO57_09015 [Leptospira langatensis]TGL39277.1 hypothetical protein EHQ53_14365 [Leptospira langatensis]